MKFLIFSDIHSDLAALNALMDTEADYYICAGDLVNWSRRIDACGEILRRRAGKVLLVPGNHETVDQVAQLCARHGLQNLHETSVELAGHHFAGLGYSSLTPFDTPGEYTEPEIAERLARFETLKPLVLICHAPPYHTRLDRIRNLLHAGSKSVRDFLMRHQPEYFFCGHIHEAAGVSEILGRTKSMNVGKKGYLLELEVPQ